MYLTGIFLLRLQISKFTAELNLKRRICNLLSFSCGEIFNEKKKGIKWETTTTTKAIRKKERINGMNVGKSNSSI